MNESHIEEINGERIEIVTPAVVERAMQRTGKSSPFELTQGDLRDALENP